MFLKKLIFKDIPYNKTHNYRYNHYLQERYKDGNSLLLRIQDFYC